MEDGAPIWIQLDQPLALVGAPWVGCLTFLGCLLPRAAVRLKEVSVCVLDKKEVYMRVVLLSPAVPSFKKIQTLWSHYVVPWKLI